MSHLQTFGITKNPVLYNIKDKIHFHEFSLVKVYKNQPIIIIILFQHKTI